MNLLFVLGYICKKRRVCSVEILSYLSKKSKQKLIHTPSFVTSANFLALSSVMKDIEIVSGNAF